MAKLYVPIQKTRKKKTYRKPELKTIDPRAAIERLTPRALAGDKSAQDLIETIRKVHAIAND